MIKRSWPRHMLHARGVFRTVQDWIGGQYDEMFKTSTPKTIIAHLKRESKELEDALDLNQTKEEAADVLLLLMHLAHKHKFNLLTEALKKHKVNLTRKWGEPDEEGVSEHIKGVSEHIKGTK